MTLDTFLGILGVGLSFYSIFQAGSAKEIANETKIEVRELLKTTDLSKLIARLEIAINEIKVFGPSASTNSLSGVNKQKVADHLQDFALFLNENAESLGNAEKNAVKISYESLMQTLPQFSDTNISMDDSKKIGSQILANLSNLNSKLKKGLTKKITS